MSRTLIVVASVLKPVYEPRMYEKIAITLSKNPATEVHVVGYGKVNEQLRTSVFAHGLGVFKRLSVKRLLAPWKVLRFLFSRKPQVVIACTHELLIPFVLYKWMHPSVKLVYDLQENYYLNILHTHAFPRILRWPLALWIRCKEKFTLSFFSKIIAAENCYLEEMPFISKKAIVISNKTIVDQQTLKSRTAKSLQARTCMLFSGTVAESYGIYDAVALIEKLHQIDSAFYLKIVGYCANEKERKKLEDFLKDKDYVLYDRLDQPVSHADILKAIVDADWGLIAYQDNTATKRRIPTKLYEYISYRLPVLSTNNVTWQELVSLYDAGLCINYKQTHIDLLVRLLQMPGYYRTTADFSELNWEKEEEKLTRLISTLS